MATLVSQHAHMVSLKVTHFIYCAYELMLLVNLNVLFIVFFLYYFTFNSYIIRRSIDNIREALPFFISFLSILDSSQSPIFSPT